MRKVIDGKVYDTETATCIHKYWNGLGNNDFNNLEENLYVTKKGSWFLSGSGGAMTKYSEPCGNATGGGSGLIPVSLENARAWLEQHDAPAELIEKYFPVELA